MRQVSETRVEGAKRSQASEEFEPATVDLNELMLLGDPITISIRTHFQKITDTGSEIRAHKDINVPERGCMCE